jgi:hypothetical protein
MMCILFITLLNREIASMRLPQHMSRLQIATKSFRHRVSPFSKIMPFL